MVGSQQGLRVAGRVAAEMETMMGPDEHLAAVLAAEADGQDGDFLFFWGHQPRPDGTIGPSWRDSDWPSEGSGRAATMT